MLRGSTIEVHVGRRASEVDALLGDPSPGWAYLTAWNPRSAPIGRATNAARHRACEHLLRALGYRFLRGWGIAHDDSWRERSLLVLDIGRERALDVARVFEQNAIVVGKPGRAAQLAYLSG